LIRDKDRHGKIRYYVMPEAANGRLKAIRQVFAYAVKTDLAKSNPARDVEYLRTASDDD
jgi:hypothetical protein